MKKAASRLLLNPSVPTRFKQAIASALHALPESETARIIEWIQALRLIHSSNASSSEKQKQAEELSSPPELFLEVIKNHISEWAESKSISNKKNIRSILDHASALIGPRRLIALGIVGVGVNQISSRLLVLPQSSVFLDWLEEVCTKSTTPPK